MNPAPPVTNVRIITSPTQIPDGMPLVRVARTGGAAPRLVRRRLLVVPAAGSWRARRQQVVAERTHGKWKRPPLDRLAGIRLARPLDGQGDFVTAGHELPGGDLALDGDARELVLPLEQAQGADRVDAGG